MQHYKWGISAVIEIESHVAQAEISQDTGGGGAPPNFNTPTKCINR